ncbi:MAG: DUF1345 domain-containing protein [Novosphingobium sp.]|nr:DUF1345 domain-containing protein [Novosphingobium sp.]
MSGQGEGDRAGRSAPDDGAARDLAQALGLGNRLAPPRFLMFVALLPLTFIAHRLLVAGADWREGVVIAFDLAAFCFLASLVPLLRDSRIADIRRHARQNDANRTLILIVTVLLTLVVMAAIGGELDRARQADLPAVVKLVATLLLTWLFANAVYGLHYAHAFYTRHGDGGGTDAGGLEFPGTKTPGYGDFAYFAFTVGMTFQTSDVAITTPGLRRIVLLHGFATFVFNIGVIAFTINVLGGG